MHSRFVAVVVRKVKSRSFTSSVCHGIGAWHGIVDTPEQPPVEMTSFLGRLLSMSSQETIVRSFVRRKTERSRTPIASPTTHAKARNTISFERAYGTQRASDGIFPWARSSRKYRQRKIRRRSKCERHGHILLLRASKSKHTSLYRRG
jgi:hypothetical protein